MTNTTSRPFRLGATLAAAAFALGLASTGAASAEPVSVALLSAKMQNDHAEWVPTTQAERDRMGKIREIFTSMLETSGRYRFTRLDPSMQAKVEGEQQLGDCGGCEFKFGKELGVRQIAWIEVQKVSELILNVNVYMADVETGQRIFVKSVDMRGNNDESWAHSMKYLVKNYLLEQPKS